MNLVINSSMYNERIACCHTNLVTAMCEQYILCRCLDLGAGWENKYYLNVNNQTQLFSLTLGDSFEHVSFYILCCPPQRCRRRRRRRVVLRRRPLRFGPFLVLRGGFEDCLLDSTSLACSFSQRPVTYVDNTSPALILTPMEEDQLCKQRENTLTMKFSAARPNLYVIRSHIRSEDHTRHITLHLSSPADTTRPLARTTTKIKMTLFCLFRWMLNA